MKTKIALSILIGATLLCGCQPNATPSPQPDAPAGRFDEQLQEVRIANLESNLNWQIEQDRKLWAVISQIEDTDSNMITAIERLNQRQP